MAGATTDLEGEREGKINSEAAAILSYDPEKGREAEETPDSQLILVCLQDEHPRDVDLGVTIPEEKLRQGWIPVLRYLRELKGQGSVLVAEVRLVFMGEGRQGKSSLMRALLDPAARTAPIAADDRTVGVDVHAGWRPGGSDGPAIHLWDLAGQKAYGSGHSAIITKRCLFVLVFSPKEEKEAAEIVDQQLLPWMQMIHAQSPGASILLVCTHAESPAAGSTLADWKARAATLAEDVLHKVLDLEQQFNRDAVEEVENLQERLSEAEGRLEASIKRSPALRQESVDDAEDRQASGLLQQEVASLKERLRSLRSKDGQTLQMKVVHGRVWLVESVEGDGSTVQSLRETIVETVCELPLMKDSVPRGWVLVRQALRGLQEATVLKQAEALRRMQVRELGMNEAEAWEAVVFWALLGDVKVHGDILVPNVLLLIDLLRPLVHHDPVKSLKQMLRPAAATKCDELVVPKYAMMQPKEREAVMGMVKVLVEDRVLKEQLLPYLFCWDSLNPEERDASLKVLEACDLVVRYQSSDWLATCRLSEAPVQPEAGIEDWASSGILARYCMRFVPAGLFSSFQALHIVNKDYSSATSMIEQVDSTNLRLKVMTIFGKDGDETFECIQARVVSCIENEDGEREMQVQIQCSTVSLFRSACSGLESLMQERFPGLVHTTAVTFPYSVGGQENTLEWKVDRTGSSLGTLLAQKRWDQAISATVLKTKVKIQNLAVRKVLRSVKPLFFLSHSWSDGSAQATEGLTLMIETRSREIVWVDKEEMAAETQFRSRMLEGINNARCILVCLSLVYLTSANCLHELCAALEAHANEGKHVIVVSVDPSVTLKSIANWAVDKDLEVTDKNGKSCTIGRTTLALVKGRLVGVKIYEEWIDCRGEATEPRRRALQEMLESLRKPLPRGSSPLRLDVKFDGAWCIDHMTNQ